MFSKYLKYVIPSLIVIADLLTKYLVKFNFKMGVSHNVLGNFFRLTYIENPGIAFGMFAGISHESLIKNLVFLVVTLIAVAFIIYLIKKSEDKMVLTAYYFILGGALGNILERTFGHLIYFGKFKIFYGKVVDFVDIGFGSHRWPFFNIADSFITIGVALLIIYVVFFENKDKNKKENAK